MKVGERRVIGREVMRMTVGFSFVALVRVRSMVTGEAVTASMNENLGHGLPALDASRSLAGSESAQYEADT